MVLIRQKPKKPCYNNTAKIKTVVPTIMITVGDEKERNFFAVKSRILYYYQTIILILIYRGESFDSFSSIHIFQAHFFFIYIYIYIYIYSYSIAVLSVWTTSILNLPLSPTLSIISDSEYILQSQANKYSVHSQGHNLTVLRLLLHSLHTLGYIIVRIVVFLEFYHSQ